MIGKSSTAVRSVMKKAVPVYIAHQHGASRVINEQAVDVAANLLKNGSVIAVPTDTVYGVAGMAQISSAVDRLYSIKERNPLKPVAVCVADVDDIYKWCKVVVPRDVLSDLLPGPVTVAFERLPCLNASVNPETQLLGVRVPDSEFIRSVARLCDSPLALTSANVSDQKSPTSIKEFEHLWPRLDAVFDGGLLGETDPNALGSTVVDLSIPNYYRIIREGCAYSLVRNILENSHSFKQL